MFKNLKIGSIIGEALNSLDNVAKETLEGLNMYLLNIIMFDEVSLVFVLSYRGYHRHGIGHSNSNCEEETAK
jgi:hypothetical protein